MAPHRPPAAMRVLHSLKRSAERARSLHAQRARPAHGLSSELKAPSTANESGPQPGSLKLAMLGPQRTEREGRVIWLSQLKLLQPDKTQSCKLWLGAFSLALTRHPSAPEI